jgi:hypothetical protein
MTAKKYICKKIIMIVKQIYNTDHKKQIVVNLPDNFRRKRRVLVVLDDSVDSNTEKQELMKKAKNDLLFQADIEEISNDFRDIDSESL